VTHQTFPTSEARPENAPTEASGYKLFVGNFNYSSWSMRAWFGMKLFDLDFTVEMIPLFEDGSDERIRANSPSGLVPALHHGDLVVWDSLAILEYLADAHPEKAMRPTDPMQRARMRSISCEMHAGFTALRSVLHTNVRARYPGYGQTDAVMKDVARIDQIWSQCLNDSGGDGDFLFGAPSIADAMYAPVVTRFRTYDVPLSPVAERYVERTLDHPVMQEWDRVAEAEPWEIPRIEDDLKRNGAREYAVKP
jgi:glutathione S-transferase